MKRTLFLFLAVIIAVDVPCGASSDEALFQRKVTSASSLKIAKDDLCALVLLEKWKQKSLCDDVSDNEIFNAVRFPMDITRAQLRGTVMCEEQNSMLLRLQSAHCKGDASVMYHVRGKIKDRFQSARERKFSGTYLPQYCLQEAWSVLSLFLAPHDEPITRQVYVYESNISATRTSAGAV